MNCGNFESGCLLEAGLGKEHLGGKFPEFGHRSLSKLGLGQYSCHRGGVMALRSELGNKGNHVGCRGVVNLGQ